MVPIGDTEGGFCIDAKEATLRDWAYCVARGHCAPLDATVKNAGVRPDIARRHAVFCSASRMDLDLPANCIDWASARAFCLDRGTRLPSLREWLRAARGVEGDRERPWGANAVDGKRANVCDERCVAWGMEAGLLLSSMHSTADGFAGPIAPGTYPKGRSPEGVDDLFGNVAEWLLDGDDRERATIGGSFLTSREEQLGEPTGMDPRAKSPTVGVRCASARVD
jgi:formylglycine-generating enzyme required for sulfatase activity